MERERALANVNVAVGSAREQLAKAAADLSAVESEMDRIAVLSEELRQLQSAVDTLIAQATSADEVPADHLDLNARRAVFVAYLRKFLHGLGHGGVVTEPDAPITLDGRRARQAIIAGSSSRTCWPSLKHLRRRQDCIRGSRS